MNSIFNCDTAFFEHVGEFAHGVLRLSSGETVTGHEDNFVRVCELCGDVVETNFAHRSLLLAFGYGRRGASECTKQDVGHRAIHRAAHQYRKYETREAVEGAR